MEANFSTLKSHGTKCTTTYTKNSKASFPKLSTSQLSTWIALSHFILCVCHFNRKNQSDGITQDKTSGRRPDALVESPGLGFLGTSMCRMLLIPIRAPLGPRNFQCARQRINKTIFTVRSTKSQYNELFIHW